MARRYLNRKNNSQLPKLKAHHINDYLDSDFPLEEKLIEYMINIIERYPIHNKMMNFIMNLMNIIERQEFVNSAYQGVIPEDENHKKNENHYELVVSRLHEPIHIVDEFVTDIYRSKLNVSEYDIKKYIL